jgi:hypothetical protein
MMRISMMNLVLHGIRNANIKRANALSELGGLTEEDLKRRYKVILSNPPFAGVLPKESIRRDLPTDSKKSELLFLGVVMEALAPGGRAAVLVPEGLLFGSTSAHVELRRKLVENYDLQAVISLPAGVFKPYAGVKTGVLVFRRPTAEKKDKHSGKVLFAEIKNDGFDPDKITQGGRPETPEKNDIPELLHQWQIFRESGFQKPPGVKAGTLLPPGAEEIRAQDPGLANWEDMKLLLQEHGAAEKLEGFTASRFRLVEGAVTTHDDPVEVLRLRDGLSYMLGDGDGAPVAGPNGEKVHRLGLNIPIVAELLRKLALPEMPTGAAHLRWPQGISAEGIFTGKATAVFGLLRQTFKTDQRTGWIEQGCALSCFVASPGGEARLIEGPQKQVLLRALAKGVVRIKPEDGADASMRLKDTETQLCTNLRRPTEAELRDGIRHSVAPLFAAIITP